MPKKVYAVTNIKVGNAEDEYWAAGTEVDVSKFTKEQLKEMHDAGAIEIKTVEEEMTEPETPAEMLDAVVETHAEEAPAEEAPASTEEEAESTE